MARSLLRDVSRRLKRQTISCGAVLPNLAQFDVKAQVVHGQAVPGTYLALTMAYAVLYIAMLLVVAAFVFSKRDFK